MILKVDVIFSTDMYVEGSAKGTERTYRGCGERLFIQGENTKRPSNWKSCLTNEDNKKQLEQAMRMA